MARRSSSQPHRRRILNLRVAGVVLAVLATMVYVNLAQLDDDNEAAFRSSAVLAHDVERVLVARRRETASNAWSEYCALVVAGFGLVLALSGRPVARLLAREIERGRRPTGNPEDACLLPAGPKYRKAPLRERTFHD